MPQEQIYSELASFQIHLDKRAAEEEKNGRDGSWLRRSVQSRLGLDDAQFSSFREYALRLADDLRPIDRQTHRIFQKERAAIRKAAQASVPLSTLPQDGSLRAQMRQLTHDRNLAIHTEFSWLQAALDPLARARLAQLAASVPTDPRQILRHAATLSAANAERKAHPAVLSPAPLNTVYGSGEDANLFASACLDDEFSYPDCDFAIGAGISDSSNTEQIEVYAQAFMSGAFMDAYDEWPGVAVDLLDNGDDIDGNENDNLDMEDLASTDVVDPIRIGDTYTSVGTPLECYIADEEGDYECDPDDGDQIPVSTSTAAPVISSISPASANPGASGTMTIAGSNLLNLFDQVGQPDVTVSGSGVTFSLPEVPSPSNTEVQIDYAVASNATPGPFNVTVTTNWGESNAKTFTVACGMPTISSLSSSTWNAGQTYNIEIVGTNFCSSSTVAVATQAGSVTVSSFSYVSPTEMTATVTPLADDPTETATLTLTNPGTGPAFRAGQPKPRASASRSASKQAQINAFALPAPIIQWNGKTISGTSNQSAVVGQPINLLTQYTLPEGMTVQSTTWTVGGTNIGGYTPTATSPTTYATASVTQTKLTSPTIAFYWVYPKSKVPVTFQYCVTLAGDTIECASSTATFGNITGPVGSVSTLTTGWTITPSIPNCNLPPTNVQLLLFGSLSGGTTCSKVLTQSGISFVNLTTSSLSGQTEWVQILTNNTIIGTTTGGTSVTVNGGTGLDNTYPYPHLTANVNQTNDSPSNGLPSNAAGGTIYATDERQFTAKMYLMWTSSIAGSIPVPLGYTQWTIDGIATYNSTKASWKASTGKQQSINPTFTSLTTDDGTSSHGYPVWSAVVLNK